MMKLRQNTNAGTKTNAIIVIVVAVVVCISIYFFVISPGASADHREVAQAIKIKDVTKGYWLDLEYVSAKDMRWLSLVPVEVDFRSGETYTQTFWLWRNPAGDVDFCATIWGPDESGDAYYIEFARLNSHEIDILYAGTVVATFSHIADWSSPEQLGYVVLKVESP